MEILAPAGNWAMARTAEKAGADSIYFGIKGLNMRESANNFNLSDLSKISKLNMNKYLTLNTIVFDNEFKRIDRILDKAKGKVDAIICWDMGVLSRAVKKGFDVHISTQASIANSDALKFYKEAGATRAILARELSLEQIRKLKKVIEIECFGHGAMCVAVSGRCFMSLDAFNMSANRGKCVQPCRRKYAISDAETGKKFNIRGGYVMSAKDLCTLPFLDKIAKSGITALKIEGRSKTPEYVKYVVEAYREAFNRLDKGKFYVGDLVDKLKMVYNRKFSSGFYLGLPSSDDFADFYGGASKTRKLEIGKVVNFYGKKNVAVFNVFKDLKVGDNLLIIGNKTGAVEFRVEEMQINGVDVSKIKKGLVGVKIKEKVRKNDKIYKFQ